MKTVPDKWVVISIKKEGEPDVFKVFGSWAGGYLDGDSWKLNSGIRHVYKEREDYRFVGYSGSHYVCNENHYGVVGSYNQGVLDKFIRSGREYGYEVEVLPEDYNFEILNN
jgi:hypothetical protein